MKPKYHLLMILLFLPGAGFAESILKFGVKPSNSPEVNKLNLQKAIDSMSAIGGLILKRNVSLIGANAATPPGTAHPSKPQPVGSVIGITDRVNVFITVESATQISGIQFWYSQQATRNWQIAQGSIIANTGDAVENIHPFLIEGKGHTAISNVEAFSGKNGALTTLGVSCDFLRVTGNDTCTISLIGCRMRNYTSDQPLTIENKNAVIQAVACIDKSEQAFNK